MNILVTGCNGQLGNELQILEKNRAQFHWFNTDVNDLDVTDQQAVELFVGKNAIDGIINCAAYTNVDKAESDNALCQSLNADAPRYLSAAIEQRKGWMIHISTDYVFDGTKHTPYQEDDKTCPNSVYGRTKLAGEEAVRRNCQRSMIIRTAWLYSPFGHNFVKTMLRLGKEKDEIGVIFDQIGTPTYAADLAQAIIRIIDDGIKPGIYHFSNEGVTSWFDFTIMIHQLAGINNCVVSPLHTSEYPTPARRPFYDILDKSKIKNTYGMEIPYWIDSLKKCIQRL